MSKPDRALIAETEEVSNHALVNWGAVLRFMGIGRHAWQRAADAARLKASLRAAGRETRFEVKKDSRGLVRLGLDGDVPELAACGAIWTRARTISARSFNRSTILVEAVFPLRLEEALADISRWEESEKAAEKAAAEKKAAADAEAAAKAAAAMRAAAERAAQREAAALEKLRSLGLSGAAIKDGVVVVGEKPSSVRWSEMYQSWEVGTYAGAQDMAIWRALQ